MEDWARLIAQLARRRGYQVGESGDSIIVSHPEAPLQLHARRTPRGIEIRLEAPGVEDYLEELVDASPAPQDVLEQVIDDLTDLALEASRLLKGRGYRVELRLRDTAIDLLERLEELQEAG